ncbi:MAG TPA: hypothetical protein VJZ71_09745 [Phycisphaerae bacterium]|nr:hypothetical protein [Phycisphaerae bacterium]
MNSPSPASLADSPPDLTSRHAALLLALVVLVGAALRVYHFKGFDHSDEMAYLQAASDLASGDYRFPHSGYGNHAWLRYTIVLPLALAIRTCGPDDRACAVPLFFASLVAILVAYGIGRDLCRSRAAGLLMAAILAINIRDVGWATRFYPDAVQSLFLALCMWLVIRSRPSDLPVHSDLSRSLSRPLKRSAFLGGLCFALAYNSNLISVIFLPALVAVLLATYPWRCALRLAAWMLAGSAALYLPLLVFFWTAGGTPFLEFAAVAQANETRAEAMSFGTLLLKVFVRKVGEIGTKIVTADFYEVQRILLTDAGYLAIARPAAVCLAVGLFVRGRTDRERWAWRVAALWLLALYLVYEFGTPFLPLRKVPRYLHMFIFPMAAIIVATLSPHLHRRAVVQGVLVGLALGAAYYAMPSIAPTTAITWAAGLASVFALGLALFVRKSLAQASGIGLLTLSLLFWCRSLGVGLLPHTQLSRALQRLDLPAPVYTNSWRTEMLLECLPLHDRGPDGVILSCEAAPLMDAFDRGHAVILYTRPGAQYTYCDLPPVETGRLLGEFENRADKLFDNGLYKIYARRPETP